jgi:hypothetical protein
LERSLGRRITHLETWEDESNQKQYDSVGGATLCGGVPFFYNLETGKSICGAAPCEALVKWAKGKHS